MEKGPMMKFLQIVNQDHIIDLTCKQELFCCYRMIKLYLSIKYKCNMDHNSICKNTNLKQKPTLTLL